MDIFENLTLQESNKTTDLFFQQSFETSQDKSTFNTPFNPPKPEESNYTTKQTNKNLLDDIILGKTSNVVNNNMENNVNINQSYNNSNNNNTFTNFNQNNSSNLNYINNMN